MINQFIFEAGSTKTTVLMKKLVAIGAAKRDIGNSTLYELHLTGFNPNRPATDFENELKQIDIQPNDQIIFYGSGLNAEVNKDKIRQLFRSFFKANVLVFDDVLGAARASFMHQSGIIGIMGTGGVAAYYDGSEIQVIRGGYGYLIDDLGGGYELGKVIISAWLNRSLPIQLSAQIQALVGFSRDEFIPNYYQHPELGGHAKGLSLIASTVKLLPNFVSEPQVKALLTDYFELFIKRHILTLCEETNARTIRLTGTIAASFEPILRSILAELGYELKGIVRFPAVELWYYHFQAETKISV